MGLLSTRNVLDCVIVVCSLAISMYDSRIYEDDNLVESIMHV